MAVSFKTVFYEIGNGSFLPFYDKIRPIKHQTRLKYPHLWPFGISGFFLMFCELTFTDCICLLYSIKTLFYKLLNLISPNLKLTPASTGPCFRHCEPVFMDRIKKHGFWLKYHAFCAKTRISYQESKLLI